MDFTPDYSFRIQRPDKILLSGRLQHLVDSCLGCIAAKGNVSLAEIQSGKPDDLTILGHNGDLLRNEFTLQSV